jgi:hypothetical protein
MRKIGKRSENRSKCIIARMIDSNEDVCLILNSVRKSSPFNHISFNGRRTSNSYVRDVIPEVIPFLMNFTKRSLEFWKEEMCIHNRIIQRGLKMGLLKHIPQFHYFSLDKYLLHQHSKKLADVLQCHARFAEKVLHLIHVKPDACAWSFNDKLLIQRRDWQRLARCVLNLVKLLDDAEQFDDHAADSRWPHLDRLLVAKRQAARLYGTLALADDAVPRLSLQ